MVFLFFSSSFEEIQSIAKYLQENTKYRPKIGIVCGTGLGTLVNVVEDQNVFPYNKIPNFPVSTGCVTDIENYTIQKKSYKLFKHEYNVLASNWNKLPNVKSVSCMADSFILNFCSP